MPSADFCAVFGRPCSRPSPSRDAAQTSRGKPDCLPRTTAGSTLGALDGYGLCGERPARPAPRASCPVLVHRPARLLRASFRPHLAATPLRFASPSPPSGWAGDSHPQAVRHARHTAQKRDIQSRFFAQLRPCAATGCSRKSARSPRRPHPARTSDGPGSTPTDGLSTVTSRQPHHAPASPELLRDPALTDCRGNWVDRGLDGRACVVTKAVAVRWPKHEAD